MTHSHSLSLARSLSRFLSVCLARHRFPCSCCDLILANPVTLDRPQNPTWKAFDLTGKKDVLLSRSSGELPLPFLYHIITHHSQ